MTIKDLLTNRELLGKCIISDSNNRIKFEFEDSSADGMKYRYDVKEFAYVPDDVENYGISGAEVYEVVPSCYA